MTNRNTFKQCFSALDPHITQIVSSAISQFRLVIGIKINRWFNGLCTANTIIVRSLNNLYYCKHTMKGGEYIK